MISIFRDKIKIFSNHLELIKDRVERAYFEVWYKIKAFF